MDSSEILKIVEQIHRERNIDKEKLFTGIQNALVEAIKKTSSTDSDASIDAYIDRKSGELSVLRDGVPLLDKEIGERIGAQAAKQAIVLAIRKAESDRVYDEYAPLTGQLVYGTITNREHGDFVVRLPNAEAILPRNELLIHIPRDEQGAPILDKLPAVCAVVKEVVRTDTKTKILLTRSDQIVLRRLLERESPEIADGLIEIVHIERKPGFRAKVAVISHDVSVDLVGACVGPGGSRTRAISDELGGERIDVIPWSDDAKTNVRAALKPAAIENVIMLPLLGRAIVLVDEKERKIAIGKRGQNVNLASRLCVWDIDVMTQEELDLAIERSREELLKIEGITPELANSLTGEGFFTYDDLSIIDPDDFAELSNGALTPEQAAEISDRAEQMAEALEK